MYASLLYIYFLLFTKSVSYFATHFLCNNILPFHGHYYLNVETTIVVMFGKASIFVIKLKEKETVVAAADASSSMATIAFFGSTFAGIFGLGCWLATCYWVEMIQVREKELSMNISPLSPLS